MRWRGHALVEVEGFFKSCVKRKLLIAEAEVRCLNVKLNSSIFFLTNYSICRGSLLGKKEKYDIP
jgi:hypothetical protein